MSQRYDELPETLSMTEMIRLQDALSKALIRRFERKMALAFSDIVGSTPYFARFGDEAGRKLQQRHADLVRLAISERGGRIVDTAGDGAFLCFPTADAALQSAIALQERIAGDNDSRSTDERWGVRIGVHFGPVLTDGTDVSGDAVNFCSRVAGSGERTEIRLTREAFGALTDVQLRLKCRRLGSVTLKGLERPAELLAADWLDRERFPVSYRIAGGAEERLPERDLIRFGRLKEQDGLAANDVVLQADPSSTNRISRWHFELHRRSDGFVLKSVSDALTEVDGRAVGKGEEVSVRPGTSVRVGGVLTVELLGDPRLRVSDSTVLPG